MTIVFRTLNRDIETEWLTEVEFCYNVNTSTE